MRIMELYRIQNQYKQHKKRLESIKKLNSKQKIVKLTTQHFYVTNELKKIKINAQAFQQKQQNSRREQHQERMNKTITENYKKIKHQYQSFGVFEKSPNGLKSLPKFQQTKIQYENNLLKEKIKKIKSVYKPYRRNSQYDTLNSTKTERQKIKKTSKETLLDLLKNQFKIEAKVMFPRCKSKTIELNIDEKTQSQKIQKAEQIHSNKSQQKILS